MTREETAAAIKIMQHYADGGEVDGSLRRIPSAWDPASMPSWDWWNCNYRIKPTPPAPRYEPWTLENVPVGSVVREFIGTHAVITAANRDMLYLGDERYTYQEALTNLELHDSTTGQWVPAGRKVES